MAEEDTGQEKSEEPTGKRLSKAREEGQVPRSKELNTAATLIVGSGSLIIFGGYVSQTIIGMTKHSFAFDRTMAMDPTYMISALGGATRESMLALVPFFVCMILSALIPPNLLGGWNFATKSLTPNLSNLNPIKGLKKVFSVRGLVEMLKAIAKILVVGSVGIFLLYGMQGDILGIGHESLRQALDHSLTIFLWSAFALCLSTLLIALIDMPYQVYDHKKKLKMTKQQVKDENKDSEGNPQVKGRIRQIQIQLARSRMMAAVPEADVVITNPTHYAVALKYDTEGGGAPQLLAKGTDQIAFQIREIADAHGVPIVRSPKLARAIFHTTELEQEIPSGLYMAVAQVLAYVFHLKNFRARKGQRPQMPENLPIPDGMDPLGRDD